MTGIAERAAALRGEVPAGVTLVAVSKTHPAEAIREAYAAGLRDFGENYAQEWREKADALQDLADLRWHFIGGLQTNKVKYLAGRVTAIHTVDARMPAATMATITSRRRAPSPRSSSRASWPSRHPERIRARTSGCCATCATGSGSPGSPSG